MRGDLGFSGERNSERGMRKTCYWEKIYFYYLSQVKAKVIWFIVKARPDLYLDFVIRYLYFWVAFGHLVFALIDRVYVIFYTSFELFYLARLTHLCIICHWDLLLSHNDTLVELFAAYCFYPVKRSSDFVLDLIFEIVTSVHTSLVTKISFTILHK